MLILGAWCERKPVGAPVWYRLCRSVSGGFAAGCAANPLGFAPGRGLEDGKLFPRRNVPYVKFPAARGGLGVRRLYLEAGAFSSITKPRLSRRAEDRC